MAPSASKFQRVTELAICLPQRLKAWAPELAAAELVYDVDALDLAAILDQESRGGDALQPPGPGGLGDNGHGHGLMQIDDRYHHTFLAARGPDGSVLWKDAAFNILYGARLFRDALAALNSNREAAICAYNAGLKRALEALRQPEWPDLSPNEQRTLLDAPTAGGRYVSQVLARREAFRHDEITQS